MRSPESKVLFTGTRKGIEASLVPKEGFEITFISIYGLRRAMTLSNVLLPFYLLKSVVQCFGIFRRFSPHVVFGTGGYVSGPVLFAAIISGIPTMLHEQNSRPGLTTRWLARWVTFVLLSFSQSDAYFQRKSNLRVTGNPTRFHPKTADSRSARLHFGLEQDLHTILIFGGSLGAHSINMALLEAVDEFMTSTNIQLLWQTGKTDFEEIQGRVSQYRGRMKVYPFIEDMIDAYRAADVVVCRAGASTLAEITRIGLPAILVPYPHATGRHQELNARVFVEAGAAEMISDHELNGRRLIDTITELLKEPEKRRRMSQKSRALGRPRAASAIVEAMLELVQDRNHDDDADRE